MYFVFIFVFLLLGAVLPSVFLRYIGDDPSMWEGMVLPSAVPEGLRYTAWASAIFLGIALTHRPGNPAAPRRLGRRIAPRIIAICWGLGILGQLISVALNLRYGMNPSNLTAQRPLFAVLLGYGAMIGSIAGTAFLFHELRFVGFSRRLLLYLLAVFTALGSASSRSAIVFVGLMVILGLAYSERKRTIKLPRAKVLIISAALLAGALASVIYGQKLREGETAMGPFLREGVRRVFANHLTLFIAIDRFDDVHGILMDDQPAVLFDQMFSFVRTRTRYPSALRYVELGGGAVEPDERGHIAGYAFGWLGMTYGMAGFWGGLMLVAAFLWMHMGIMLSCHRRPRSLLALLFFAIFAGSLIEFLFNLGLDSFGEKLFKNSLYAVCTYWVVMAVAYVTRERPAAETPGLLPQEVAKQ